jgi:hypothetical protein
MAINNRRIEFFMVDWFIFEISNELNYNLLSFSSDRTRPVPTKFL